MAGAGYREFQVNEVLTASNVQTYLQDQAVMVFASSAARASALVTPAEGMTTYLADINQTQFFDGTDWVSIAGWQLVKKQTIGSGVSSVTVTGAFSTNFDNYRIIVSGGVGSAAANLGLKLGATATGYYGGVVYGVYSSGASAVSVNNNAASWTTVGGVGTGGIVGQIDLTAPFLSSNTSVSASYVGLAAGGGAGQFAGFLSNSTSYTDFTITPSTGTLTGGTIYVYGWNK